MAQQQDPIQILNALLDVATQKGAFSLEQVAAGIASINTIAQHISSTAKELEAAKDKIPLPEPVLEPTKKRQK